MEKSVLCCEKFSGKMLTHELGKIVPETKITISDDCTVLAGSNTTTRFLSIHDAPELDKQELVFGALRVDALFSDHIRIFNLLCVLYA